MFTSVAAVKVLFGKNVHTVNVIEPISHVTLAHVTLYIICDSSFHALFMKSVILLLMEWNIDNLMYKETCFVLKLN